MRRSGPSCTGSVGSASHPPTTLLPCGSSGSSSKRTCWRGGSIWPPSPPTRLRPWQPNLPPSQSGRSASLKPTTPEASATSMRNNSPSAPALCGLWPLWGPPRRGGPPPPNLATTRHSSGGMASSPRRSGARTGWNRSTEAIRSSSGPWPGSSVEDTEWSSSGATTTWNCSGLWCKHGSGSTSPVSTRPLSAWTTARRSPRASWIASASDPDGLLVLRDELAGWLRTLDKPGREGDREFYLEAWNGTGRYTFDRIGRGTVHIPAVCLSIFGGIQPGKLNSYIHEAITESGGADGLLQRLQLTVWPDALGEWEKSNQWPDTVAKNQAFEIFEYLDRIDPVASGAHTEEGSIPWLGFTPEAQDLFDNWRDELENRLRSDELVGTPAFESHIAKYRSLMPSLAL
ncbi:MAG TPA: DUF3987 domain-containing protein, partial [Anaerolineae bacterium]|nr:DUF3987 domain-containing protein [Anaerolineae bacterium]